MNERRTGRRKRPRGRPQHPQSSSGPVHIWIAGFVVRRDGALAIVTAAVPSPGAVKATHQHFSRDEELKEGEKRWLGFKAFMFPTRQLAPSRGRVERMAEAEFNKLLPLLEGT